MTLEKIEQERLAFEAWMADLYPTNPQTERVGDEYSRLGTQYKWEGWQAKAAQSEWISVQDRLPEIDTTVLICTERGEIFSSWASNEEVFWFYGEEEDNRVTHWQPLPAPPPQTRSHPTRSGARGRK